MNPGHVQSCSNLAKRWTCYNRCMIKFPWQQLINLTLQWLAKYNKCLTNIPRNDSEANLLGNLWRLWRANETSGRVKRSTEKRPNVESTIKSSILKQPKNSHKTIKNIKANHTIRSCLNVRSTQSPKIMDHFTFEATNYKVCTGNIRQKSSN